MTWSDLWQDIISLIPIAGFAAAIVAVAVYVRYKGTMDALKETVSTYEGLAEAYRLEGEQLKGEIEKLRRKVADLEEQMRAQALAFEKLTEKFVDQLRVQAGG